MIELKTKLIKNVNIELYKKMRIESLKQGIKVGEMLNKILEDRYKDGQY